MTSRLHASLDGTWQFWIDPNAVLSPGQLSEEDCRDIYVPAPLQSQFDDLRDYDGVAWYRRSFTIPNEWMDRRRVVLGFGAADYLAEVWVNQVKVGEHEGGYLPFEFDVTEAIRAGENSLLVRIDDPLELHPEIPHGKQSWYGPLTGLWQTVWVESRPQFYIARARITPLQGHVTVEITSNRPPDESATLQVEILDSSGSIVSQASAPGSQISLPLEQPALWEVDAPHLYTARVTLHHGSLVDAIEEKFGFRTIEARDGRIFLNGQPLYLRAALDQDYYPHSISTPPSEEFIEEQFRKAKAMGLNCLRVHIKIADPRYYAAADRIGLLIWTELPNWELLTPAAMRRARETLTGMVERDWNHPSIIFWTIVNESWGVDLTNEEHCRWLSDTYDYLKSLDPYRLVVGNSACYSNFHVVTDIEDFHNYYSIPDRYRKWRNWLNTFAARPSWTFAFQYEGYRSWRKQMRRPWSNRIARKPAPGIRRHGKEPLIVSEFGNWGLPDISRLRDCYGGQEPWWFETGFEWGEGLVYPHGIERRFKAFHLERAFPTLEDLIQASQRLQLLSLKYEIEQIRRLEAISGYVITEFTDVHWESNGLLDICRNPKLVVEHLARLNSPDLVVPDPQRFAFWEGERCQVPLYLSHFAPYKLQDAYIEWQLEGWPEVRGSQQGIALTATRVRRLRTVSFTAPAVSKPRRARLQLRLFDGGGRLLNQNFQDLYIFPRRTAVQTQGRPLRLYAPGLEAALQALGYALSDDLAVVDLVVTSVMTDELRSYIQAGGQVVWLVEARDSLQTYLGGLKIKPRRNQAWQGDWANNLNWINQDGLLAGFPTEGLVDFAFADLIPEFIIHGMKPNDFARNVHAGLFVGWLHKPVPLIAEQRYGRGRLMICAFRLSRYLRTHPTAAILLHEMLGYLAVG